MRLRVSPLLQSGTVALLPLLVLYLAATYVPHGGGGDEGNYLWYASNLTHGYLADTATHAPNRYLWHGPGLPAVLAPLVALGLPATVSRIVDPLFLFGMVVVFRRLVGLYVS